MPYKFKPVVADPELKRLGIHDDEYMFNYEAVSRDLIRCRNNGNREEELRIIRAFARRDLFFLMYFVLDMPCNHPFLLARIKQSQAERDMVLDLWARKHWKSTINTLALPIFELIENPENRIGIFSITKNLAKKHLRRVMDTLRKCTLLLEAFPDIFYRYPERQAEKWSEGDGIYVIRKGTYLEPSVSAWGLDNLPTGFGFTILVYDDIIDLSNVSNLSQIQKAYGLFNMSLSLVADEHIKRIEGTRYDLKDPYHEIIKTKEWKVRLYPAEVDESGVGKRQGTPVFLSREKLEKYYKQRGEYVYLSQMLQNPVAESERRFNRNWLRYYKVDTQKPVMNLYLLVDPASKKKKKSDYTAMVVIGTDCLRNFWVLDIVRDKLGLKERWERLEMTVIPWGATEVGYEEYALQADIEYHEEMMIRSGTFFNIRPLGGKLGKEDRIRRLIPDFMKGRWIMPENVVYTDMAGNTRELMSEFLDEEFDGFPFGLHDDILDCMSRIYDMNPVFPKIQGVDNKKKVRHHPLDIGVKKRRTSWMAAG